MLPLNQGEILLILVKRDGRPIDDVAADMGYHKSYLPKLYKMDKLPRKAYDKSLAVFHEAAQYFAKSGESADRVEEPRALYRSGPALAETERLQAENADLRAEIARLKTELDKMSEKNDRLTEAVVNLSKRG